MPANLTPDYLAADRAFKAARTQPEKIAALEQMWAALPKHKGTEKLQADIKKKLSQARKESQKKGAAHSAPFYFVKKEGAGQVALAGPPNSGKSSLLAALTHARPEIAAYPFTTRAPLPGMMLFENVQIQLLDLPPLSEEFLEPWLPQVLRTATMSVLVVDPNDPDVLGETEFVLARLEEWRVPPPKLLLGNKLDLAGERENFEALSEIYGARFPSLGVSAATGEGLAAFARAVFDALEIVRVYTKPPGKSADFSAPYVLRKGETVMDAAAHVHRDFADHYKYARLFRGPGGAGGLMVERGHLVEDGDILEFHM
jgi:ribosome-interacting GTPase 1